MWVVASICPTIGSQLGQIPCIFSHFCSIWLTHGKKKEGSWNSFKTITPIFIKYTSNMVIIRDIYGSFKTIAFFCISSTFWLQIQSNQAKTSPNTSKFKFSNSIVSIMPIVHPCEQIWQSVKKHTQIMITPTIRLLGS